MAEGVGRRGRRSIFRHTLETGEPHVVPEHIEERLDRDVTEFYEWQVNRIPLPGDRHGVVCYFRDISRSVMAREALREADSRKDEFLATLSHELAQSAGAAAQLHRNPEDRGHGGPAAPTWPLASWGVSSTTWCDWSTT